MHLLFDMPKLKQLTCSLLAQESSEPFQEYQTAYGDGYVETYVAVPDDSEAFWIRLYSNGYIAPGLSMFVYIDGVYQCNRNQQDLRIPSESEFATDSTDIDFRVRQKERFLSNGGFSAKAWKFAKVETGMFAWIHDTYVQ